MNGPGDAGNQHGEEHQLRERRAQHPVMRWPADLAVDHGVIWEATDRRAAARPRPFWAGLSRTTAPPSRTPRSSVADPGGILRLASPEAIGPVAQVRMTGMNTGWILTDGGASHGVGRPAPADGRAPRAASRPRQHLGSDGGQRPQQSVGGGGCAAPDGRDLSHGQWGALVDIGPGGAHLVWRQRCADRVRLPAGGVAGSAHSGQRQPQRDPVRPDGRRRHVT